MFLEKLLPLANGVIFPQSVHSKKFSSALNIHPVAASRTADIFSMITLFDSAEKVANFSKPLLTVQSHGGSVLIVLFVLFPCEQFILQFSHTSFYLHFHHNMRVLYYCYQNFQISKFRIIKKTFLPQQLQPSQSLAKPLFAQTQIIPKLLLYQENRLQRSSFHELFKVISVFKYFFNAMQYVQYERSASRFFDKSIAQNKSIAQKCDRLYKTHQIKIQYINMNLSEFQETIGRKDVAIQTHFNDYLSCTDSESK